MNRVTTSALRARQASGRGLQNQAHRGEVREWNLDLAAADGDGIALGSAAKIARLGLRNVHLLGQTSPAGSVLAGLFPKPKQDTLAVRVGAKGRDQHAPARELNSGWRGWQRAGRTVEKRGRRARSGLPGVRDQVGLDPFPLDRPDANPRLPRAADPLLEIRPPHVVEQIHENDRLP